MVLFINCIEEFNFFAKNNGYLLCYASMASQVVLSKS